MTYYRMLLVCFMNSCFLMKFMWNTLKFLVGRSHNLPFVCNKNKYNFYDHIFTINLTRTWFHVELDIMCIIYLISNLLIINTCGILMTGHNRMLLKWLSLNLYYFTMFNLSHTLLHHLIHHKSYYFIECLIFNQWRVTYDKWVNFRRFTITTAKW